MDVKEFETLTDEQKEKYLGKNIGFQRIRRVTGYLNPDARQWNDGKQQELAMRKKHSLDF